MSLPLFLQDHKFLQELDKLHIKQQYVKITVLNWQEQPLLEIQGQVINGSVNLDGNSSMRRTASLSVFAEEKDNNLENIDHIFSINKKCKIELGIVNTVPNLIIQEKDQEGFIINHIIDYKERYGKIVWFPLGIYVIFNPSIGHSSTGVQISMNLKDKMCLLNGDLGGQIHSSVQFSYQDEEVDINGMSTEKNPVLIFNIIKELVNHWGNEQLHKIIISEVPLRIKQTVKWTGKETLYLVQHLNNPKIFYTAAEALDFISQENLDIDVVLKLIQPGYDVGFKYVDFTFPGQLVCNAGDTVTSVLDKIIGVLGNYEYFYDVEGNFRFQQKQNYLNMTNTAYWTKEQKEDKKIGNLPTDVYEAELYRLSKPIYNFTHNEYTTAFNNTLNYNNIKNDFVVWGSRASVDGNTRIPCRFHLAIDKIPELHTHNIILFESGQPPYTVTRAVAAKKSDLTDPDKEVITRTAADWREEIYYQMLEDQLWGTGQNTELNNTYFQYYAQLKEQFPKIFDLKTQTYKNNMEKTPDQIDYFLDFIDENSKLGQYSVNNIGRRSKIIGDNNEGINCVFEPEIPDIIYLNAKEYSQEEYQEVIRNLSNYGQYWTQIPLELSDLLDTGGTFNSCFEKIKDLLYQYTHVNNTISITSLPIYYLEPNTRITVEDKPAGIYGDYIIQSISLPLDTSSTMTINAYKALQKI